jgi:hypothetical protein
MQKLCNQLIINNLDGGKRFSNLGNDLQVVSATPYYYSIIPTASPTKPNGSVADVFWFFVALRHCEQSVAIQTINLFPGLLHCVRKDAKRVWEQSPESLNLKSLNIKFLN